MIMAGGQGTRLWPMSRQHQPKQLLRFIERPEEPGRMRSLLELAAGRLEGVVPEDRRYICTAERYRAQILESLPQFSHDRLLGEPVARDTVNAVGFAAAALEKRDPDAIFAVLTADHIIEPARRFAEVMREGFALVEEDPSRFVTFAVRPTYPATGFGYVERAGAVPGRPGAFHVRQFVEKPGLEKAKEYIASGTFGWNSGMFVFSARAVMGALEKYLPETAAGLRRIQSALGTGRERATLDDVYPTLKKISLDYAIMEPASKERPSPVYGVTMDLDWLDVGSWPSYAETLHPDRAGNRTSGPAQSVIVGGTGNLVVSGAGPAHTVAILGCSDLVVVHTPEATLVMPLAEAQRLKDLHAALPDGLK